MSTKNNIDKKNGLNVYYSTDIHTNYSIMVFAHSTQEAKKIAWSSADYQEFFDIRIHLAEDHLFVYANRKKLENNEAHYEYNIISCDSCNYAYCNVIDDKCENCGDNPGNKLINLYKRWRACQLSIILELMQS